MNSLKSHLLCGLINNQKGVSAILIAIVLPVLLGFSALAIDVGYMYATRNELQNIADAAALAGAGELGRIYLNEVAPKDHSSHILTTGTDSQEERIKDEARNVALLNKSANEYIAIDPDNVFIGTWNWEWTEGDPDPLTETIVSPDAVRVIARSNTPVNTFFARIFSFFGGNHDKFESSAVATAAISGMSIADEGLIKAPFGISDNHSCEKEILSFYPTPDSCAGWQNFFDSPDGDAVADKFIGFIDGYEVNGDAEGNKWVKDHYTGLSKDPTPAVSPEVSIGDYLEYNGGVMNKLFASGEYYETWTGENSPSGLSAANPDNYSALLAFQNLFDFFRFRDDDGSGAEKVDFCGEDYFADEVWTTVVPIYKDPKIGECSNPKQDIVTVGFAKVRIRMEYDPKFPNDPKKASLLVCYDCDAIVDTGRGGGGSIGNVKGAIPNLVE